MKRMTDWLFAATALAMMFVSPLSASAGTAEARGVVKALGEATIAVDFTARIGKLPFRDGERFQKGDLLIGFECQRYQAEVAAGSAALNAAELQHANNLRLKKHGAIGGHEVNMSEAQVAKVGAEVEALKARTAQCEITAPFNGRVIERFAQAYESPAASQPLLRIVDDSQLELELIVPSNWLGWLKQGDSFSFKVDETGETATAEVIRLGAVVDPVSQTIRIYGAFSQPTQSVLPGMSGTAVFQTPGT